MVSTRSTGGAKPTSLPSKTSKRTIAKSQPKPKTIKQVSFKPTTTQPHTAAAATAATQAPKAKVPKVSSKKWSGPKSLMGPKRHMTTKHFKECGVLFYRDRVEKHEKTCEGPPAQAVEDEPVLMDTGAQTSSYSISTSAPGTQRSPELTSPASMVTGFLKMR